MSRKDELDRLTSFLENQGYKLLDKEQQKRPTGIDIIMRNGEKTYYFSVMCLKPNKSNRYFDSTNMSEIKVAEECLTNENLEFRYILCRNDVDKEEERYVILTVEQVFAYISRPHLKLNINIPVEDVKSSTNIESKSRKTVIRCIEKLNKINDLCDKLGL